MRSSIIIKFISSLSQNHILSACLKSTSFRLNHTSSWMLIQIPMNSKRVVFLSKCDRIYEVTIFCCALRLVLEESKTGHNDISKPPFSDVTCPPPTTITSSPTGRLLYPVYPLGILSRYIQHHLCIPPFAHNARQEFCRPGYHQRVREPVLPL